ncbi:MAG: zinc-binding dehydrogenase [Verrucomicrobia subdivision 3 bacterium]|nr:zinc-binding dehydrogenase [Limisphaerales bacterium]
MKAIYLVRSGPARSAFEIREAPQPCPKESEVLIKAEAFGLNFAEVMARLKLYPDAPPLPCVLGYEVVGRVEAMGANVRSLRNGMRVVALPRFGGYAEYVVSDFRRVMAIPESMNAGVAVALAVQYSTAWFAAEELVQLRENDHVLINAAAGGVGSALVQIAKRKKCIVYGACGSDEKLEFLKTLHVDFPINYRRQNVCTEIRKLRGKLGLDVVFDSLGGSSFKQGRGLLGPGGRIVTYGVAELVRSQKPFAPLNLLWNYGFLHPLALLQQSQSVIGLSLLRAVESKPEIIQRCLQSVIDLAAKGELQPHVGGTFGASDIADAHKLLESRKSIGKIVVKW